MGLNIEQLRSEFPQLKRQVRGRNLVYLDNAATALKPRSVIDALSSYYGEEVSNIHRGAHFLGDLGTSNFEQAREAIREFVNAKSPDEIVFTSGTTGGLNLVAHVLAQSRLEPGDEILLTEMEHHSNIVPWQMAAETYDLVIKVVKITDAGEIDMDDLKTKLTPKVKVFAFTHCSNALGTINPAAELVAKARAMGALTVIDAAQSVVLHLVDVQKLNCDFLVFSGHKIFGPTGIGVLYGRKDLLNSLPPYQGGGSMISQVTFEATDYLQSPHRFEAGTPHIAGVVGLHAAIKFVQGLDAKEIENHDRALLVRAREHLQDIKGLRFIGTSPSQTNILSFFIDGVHPSDVGQILDQQGIAVRTGHHCCQPLMVRYNIPGTIRASFSIYNTLEEVDALATALRKAKEMLT